MNISSSFIEGRAYLVQCAKCGARMDWKSEKDVRPCSCGSLSFDAVPCIAETSERRTGRTARAMLNASYGAVYVWPNSNLMYPRELARKLGREDLQVVGVVWLEHRSWRGSRLSPIELDHATPAVMTDAAQDAYLEYRDTRGRQR